MKSGERRRRLQERGEGWIYDLACRERMKLRLLRKIDRADPAGVVTRRWAVIALHLWLEVPLSRLAKFYAFPCYIHGCTSGRISKVETEAHKSQRLS